MENVAADPRFEEQKNLWSNLLTQNLIEQDDPRILGKGDVFDNYPIMPKQIRFYERFFKGEKLDHVWVNETDFRPEQNEEFSK